MKKSRIPVSSTDDPQNTLSAWFRTILGAHLLATEHEVLKREMDSRFGYHLLQLGCTDLPVFSGSPVSHQFTLSTQAGEGHSHVMAVQEALPFSGESIDVVVLHHALDFSSNPHQLLREVSRVLIAGGHVMVCGFNPVSSWGIRSLFTWGKRTGPWQSSMMTSRRLNDWLKLLEFKVTSVRHGAYCWPVNSRRWIKYTSFFDGIASKLNWPTGGFYMITARKQIAPLTLAKNRKREKYPVSVGLPVAENISAAARNSQSNLASDSGEYHE